MNKNLNEILKNNGVALIMSMIECPKCNKDIWVEMGSHCGYDANLDFAVDTHCYECCQPIKVMIEPPNIKDTGFMAISEYTDFTTNKFIKNCKDGKNILRP